MLLSKPFSKLICITASPLQWCCCGGSKFTRVTTDAIGIVYFSSSIQCHIHIYRFGAVMHFIPNRHLHIYGSGAVMHCIPYKHRFISKSGAVMHFIPMGTVKTAITNKHSIVIESNSIRYQQNKVNSIIPALKVILDNIPLCCFLLPSTSYACHTLSALTSVGTAQACRVSRVQAVDTINTCIIQKDKNKK